MVPEIVEPDFVTLLVTITDMYAGSGPFGGGALLPGSVVNVAPHVGDAGNFGEALEGGRGRTTAHLVGDDHWLPQNVTAPVAPVTDHERATTSAGGVGVDQGGLAVGRREVERVAREDRLGRARAEWLRHHHVAARAAARSWRPCRTACRA